MFRGSMKAAGVVASILVFTFAAIAQHGHGNDTKTSKSDTGVLILAHGGAKNWNEEVVKLAATIDKTMPTETAFGMATKRNIQTAVDKLVARGAKRIVAVPLFISSHSSVITSTEYLLGARAEAPSALAIFAKMDHGSHGDSAGHGAHGEKKPEPADYGTTPVKTTVPIVVTSALNGHSLVADILLSRAKALSKDAKKDVVILVAHGPVRDEENNKWLADMKTLVGFMQPKSDFKRIDYLTVRDDAPEPIRSQATAELRAAVQKAKDEGSNVLIVPLLLSYGGIEKGIIKRLEGMDYKMTDQALLPDDRLAEWVMLSVKGAEKR